MGGPKEIMQERRKSALWPGKAQPGTSYFEKIEFSGNMIRAWGSSSADSVVRSSLEALLSAYCGSLVDVRAHVSATRRPRGLATVPGPRLVRQKWRNLAYLVL
jgi:hypothetical protein